MSAEEDNGVTVTPPERFAIGISFGNSNSSIAHTGSDGKAVVIANEEGDRQIPSILSYIDGEEYHGSQAKVQLIRNPKNTVAYFRDYIGQSFDSIDPSASHASAHPQKHDSGVAFSIHDTSAEDANTVTVREITTRHIKRLVSSASDFLGQAVNAVVVTVPTNFSDAQKKELETSAKDAGVEVLQFISEPVAAALAYDARPESEVHDKVIVVADLGGTRSDVAVLASRGGMYSVLATSHDYEFAGQNLDQVLIDYFAKEFIKKHKTDPRENPRGLAKLKAESEATKKALSLGANASISIESLVEGIDFSSTVNRTRYETLAGKVFSGMARLIESTIKKAELDVLDIDEVILSGGTSHTPRIAANMASIFPQSTRILAPSTAASAINPSELSARGAAIQASLVQEFDVDDIVQSAHPMVTVAPHLHSAIGVLLLSDDKSRGIFRAVLEPETPVPAKRTVTFATPKEGGDVIIKICEGHRHIKVTSPEAKAKTSKTNGATVEDAGSDDSEADDSSDEELEDVREKAWKVGAELAEVAIRGVKKGGKVEVTLNVNAELGLQVVAREVGAKTGVRGVVEKPEH